MNTSVRIMYRFGLLLILGLYIHDSGYCFQSNTEKEGIQLDKRAFGQTPAGEKVDLYTFKNSSGVKVEIMTYGGIIILIEAPDKKGKVEDITLGFESLDKYIEGHPYFGAIVGRYGNRIGDAKFTINGKVYTLAKNNGPNSLHGGEEGFDKKVWDVEEIIQGGIPALKLTYLSKDGEEGYPGNLKCTVIYSLNDDNELKIEYLAETDKPTHVNLTNHAYFNLNGHEDMNDILNHIMLLNADRFTPVDETLIPTGELRSVAGTPMDFTKPKKIGKDIESDYKQIEIGGGYDHNFVLNKEESGALTFGGRVFEPNSGRVLEFYTTQPGIQFYTGNFLNGNEEGKGQVYRKRYGFCLETQHFPDSPNKPEFPSTLIKPGEKYHQITIYKFLPKTFE